MNSYELIGITFIGVSMALLISYLLFSRGYKRIVNKILDEYLIH